VLVASTVAGNLITRTGRYCPFPIAGTVAVTSGYALLATPRHGDRTELLAVALALVGAGLGLVMQPTVLALQNAAETRDLGAATAASTFFRQLGSTLAVGVLGGLLASRAGPALLTLTSSPGEEPASQARADVTAAVGELLLTLSAVTAIGVVIALLLPAKPPGSESTPGGEPSHAYRGSATSLAEPSSPPPAR